MPLIISERLSRNRRLMAALQGILREHKVHVSQSVIFDLGFSEPGCPTLAVCLFDTNDVLYEVVERLQKLQGCFARAVCIGAVSSEEKWSQLQCMIKPSKTGGSIRMIRVGSSPVVVFVALRSLFDSMSNASKTASQQTFFAADQDRIESASVAAGIAHTALAKMGVTRQDSSLLLDGLGSIKSLATMNLCGPRVRQSLPVDSDVLQCVQALSLIHI